MKGLQALSFLSAGTAATSAEGISCEYRQVWFRLPNAAVPSIPPEPYEGNYIRTAKYTFYNFLVINLFEQFSRIANLYFLLIAVLQLVPGLSPTHWFTTVAPLLFVLLVNAVKEIYDDCYRHKSDGEVNNRMVDLLDKDDGWKKVCWKSLQVCSTALHRWFAWNFLPLTLADRKILRAHADLDLMEGFAKYH